MQIYIPREVSCSVRDWTLKVRVLESCKDSDYAYMLEKTLVSIQTSYNNGKIIFNYNKDDNIHKSEALKR